MSTRRRVEFELVGNAGNIEAVLNRLNTGITRTARSASGVNRELGMMDRQLQAIKTTARYALAGGLIFGITGAISRLRDFQDRLAQVAALAGNVTPAGNYQGPSNNFLSRVGDQALLMSNQLGIATEDVQDYMSRFFSAFDVSRMGGDEKLMQLRNFVNEVGQLQASLGAEAGDPQQLAGGIAGFVRQIDPKGRNIGKNTERISGLIWQMLAQTPNVTGRDISRDIGRVGATMTIANMTPEQVFAVWTQAGAAGGSASVIGRGVSQLLGTSLLHPTTPAQIKAFQQAGLSTDPTTLRNQGGFSVLQQMMRAVAPRGATVRNPNALNDENLDDPEALAGAGIKGVNLTLLYQLLGRQESVRQFVNLLAQGAVPALRDHVEGLKSANAHEQQHEREQAAMRQRVLSQTAQAAANLPLQFARQARWPLEHLVAPPLIGASNFAARHPRVTQATEAALGGALAVYGASRLFRSFRKGRGLRGGAMDAAGAAITAEELPNLLHGGATDGSRANPFWVIVAPSPWAGNAATSGDPIIPNTDMRAPGMKALLRKYPFLAPGLAATAVGLPFAAAGYDFYRSSTGGGNYQVSAGAHLNKQKSVQDFLAKAIPTSSWGMREDIAAMVRKQGFQPQTIQVEGTAKNDFTIRLVDAQGRTLRIEEKKGVPVKMIPDKGTPTTQGKPGQNKGSH